MGFSTLIHPGNFLSFRKGRCVKRLLSHQRTFLLLLTTTVVSEHQQVLWCPVALRMLWRRPAHPHMQWGTLHKRCPKLREPGCFIPGTEHFSPLPWGRHSLHQSSLLHKHPWEDLLEQKGHPSHLEDMHRQRRPVESGLLALSSCEHLEFSHHPMCWVYELSLHFTGDKNVITLYGSDICGNLRNNPYEQQILIQVAPGGAWDSAFLTSFQGMLILLDQGPCLE